MEIKDHSEQVCPKGVIMDQILHRIYEIEEAAESLRKGAEDQKKTRADQMKQRTKEFDRRLEAQIHLLRAMGLEDSVRVVSLPRGSEAWYQAIEGLEKEPEGGARCTECFRLRLREAAVYAAENGFEWFCSTLTLSRHKDPLRINALGEAFAEKYGVRWLPSEFKKRGRELRSQQLCAQYGIYRQNYCGCEYSAKRIQPNMNDKKKEFEVQL